LSLTYFWVGFDDIVDRSFYAIYCAKIKKELFVEFVKFFIISLFFCAIYYAIFYANYCAKVGDVTGTLDGDANTAAVLFEDRIRKTDALEGTANLLDTTAPCLYEPGKEEDLCDERIALTVNLLNFSKSVQNTRFSHFCRSNRRKECGRGVFTRFARRDSGSSPE